MNHLQTLKDFNAWRRSDEAMDQPDPKAIGEAIDWAIYQIEETQRILNSCGLHGGYYDTANKSAEGVRDIIRALRADLNNPPHDVQCAVLGKLGVEGFTKKGVAPTHQLITIP
jgi:hypothetical protein